MKQNTIQKAVQMYNQDCSRSSVCRMIMEKEGISRTQGFYYAKKIWEENFDKEYEPKDSTNSQNKINENDFDDQVKFKDYGKDGFVSIKGNGFPPSDEEIFKQLKIDSSEWKIAKRKIREYQIARKNKSSNFVFKDGISTGQVVDKGGMYIQPLFSMELELIRILPMPIKDLVNQFKENAEKFAPKKFYIKEPNKSGNRAMLISLVDHHFGMNGIDWDLKEAEDVFVKANNYFMKIAKEQNVSQVFWQEGQDFFHIDNFKNSTTKGTQVDVNETLKRLFIKGCKLHYDIIEKWSQHFKTEVICVAGNHDGFSSFAMSECIKSFFKNNVNVLVSNNPDQERVYKAWGKVLIGLTHGDEVKKEELPMLLATESKDFSSCPYRFIFSGHIHHERSFEKHGIVTEFLPSLIGTDRYHNKNGYTCQQRRSKSFIFDKEKGLISSFFYNK